MWQVNTKELTITCFLDFFFFQKQSSFLYFLPWGLTISLIMERGKKVKSELHSFMISLLFLNTLSLLNLRGVSSRFHLIPKTRRWETSTACLSLQHISSLKHLSQQDSLAFRRWMDRLVQQMYFLLPWAPALLLRQIGVWCLTVTAKLPVLAKY